MKLTEAQRRALENISTWLHRYSKPYHKTEASKTLLAVRQNALEILEMKGMITSQRPFSSSYYAVTITPAGRDALKEIQ